MKSNIIGMLIVIGIYLLMMLYIGYYYSKKNTNTSDFYLGGRKLGPIVTAMSAEASDMSSWLLMGLPGVAYISGLANPFWTAVGLAIGTYINWLFVAKRLRQYSAINHSITIPDFFSNRFRDESHLLLGFSAIIIVTFFVPYTASGFAACGKLFSTLFGLEYFWAMLVSAVIIVSYTALGGFLAASMTDLIQSIVMTLALIIVVCFGVNMAGGLNEVISNAKSITGYLSFTSFYDAQNSAAEPFDLLTIISTLAWGLGYFGVPHVLLRFMGIQDENKLKISRRIASVWVVISMGIAIFIGFVGLMMSKSGVIPMLNGSSEAETLIIKIAICLSEYGLLAIVMAGLILAGILACTMSTADSQLLAASSSVSQNLLQECFGVKLNEKQAMITARLTVIVIAVVAVVIAADPKSSVFKIVSFAWAGFGASFGAVMLLSLYWKRMNKQGALAGMVVGAIMVFVWKYFISGLGGVFAIYELLPAFVCSMIAIIVVSLLTEAPSKEIVEEFEKVGQ